MSTTSINFKTKLLVGGEEVPLITEAVFDQSDSQDGVKKGFIFKLDRDASDPPVTIQLGKVIGFIETKLGAGNLASAPGINLIGEAFTSPAINSSNFTSSNETLINLYEFSLNSSSEEFLFSFNFDVQGADPSSGLIELPSVLASWLKIDNLSIAFKAETKKSENL